MSDVLGGGLRDLFAARPAAGSQLADAMLGTRIAVTGGSGFLGTNLIDFYLANGATELTNWDISPPRDPEQSQWWRPFDLRDKARVREEMEIVNPEVVFHLGARTDLFGKTNGDYSANVDGVRNLIESAKSMGRPPRLIFASSRLVCQIGYEPHSEIDYCPSTAYGESKVEGEQIVRKLAKDDLNWAIVRPTSIWGPWFQTPYRDFFDAVARGRYAHPANRRILKSFGFVGNTAFQLDRLMFGDFDRARYQTIYLADYPPLEVHDWANRMASFMGRGKIRSVPVPVLKAAAALGDIASIAGVKSPPLTSFRLNNLLTNMVHDTNLVETIVGDLPFTLSEGTEITVSWLKRFSQVAQG